MISGMIRAARSMTTTAASARISGVSSEGRPRDAPRSKEQKRQAQQRAKDPARRTGVKRARTALAEVRMAGSGRAWRCETRGFIGMIFAFREPYACIERIRSTIPIRRLRAMLAAVQTLCGWHRFIHQGRRETAPSARADESRPSALIFPDNAVSVERIAGSA